MDEIAEFKEKYDGQDFGTVFQDVIEGKVDECDLDNTMDYYEWLELEKEKIELETALDR